MATKLRSVSYELHCFLAGNYWFKKVLPGKIMRNFRIGISQGDHCSQFLNSIFAGRNRAQVSLFPWADRNLITVLQVQMTWVRTAAWFCRGLRIASCLPHSWIASFRWYRRTQLWKTYNIVRIHIIKIVSWKRIYRYQT